MGWLSLCLNTQHTEVGYFLIDPPGALIQTATVCILEIRRNTSESFRSSTCIQSNGHCGRLKAAWTGRVGSTCMKHHSPHNIPKTVCVCARARCSFSAEPSGACSHQVVLLPLAIPGSPGCAPGAAAALPGRCRPAAPGHTGLPGRPLQRR